MDALVAIGLILTMAIFLSGLSFSYSSPETRYQDLYYIGKDMFNVMKELKLEGIREYPSVQYYLSQGILTESDMDKSLLDIIGSFWAAGNISYAENISSDIFGGILNNTRYNVEIIISNGSSSTIYKRNISSERYVARLRTIVSGYDVGLPVEGFITRTFISRTNKIGSSYVYFGGYVGEGNLTVIMDLPDYDNIIGMEMEFDVGYDFDLYINNNYSGSYVKYTNETLRTNFFNVSSAYFGNLQEGNNIIQINSTQGYEYIGGGYIKVIYNSSSLVTEDVLEYGENASKKYWFPGISGLINLYSSVYVPGILNSITAYLHYYSNFTTYLTIGNVTVFEQFKEGENIIYIDNASMYENLTGGGLDYVFLSKKTIPIRLGVKNISYVLGEAGNADVILITDRTGSMDVCDVDIDCGESGICDSWSPCHDSRSNVARKSDGVFINTILGAEGDNNVGLIGYGERDAPTCSFHEISNDNQSLQQRVSDYDYGGSWEECGWTCISCGIVGAVEMLQENEVLYNLTVFRDSDSTEYNIGGSSQNVTLALNGLNKSRFIKSRLSILARNVDVEGGYQDCIFLNGHYLGRVCESNTVGSNGWHSCPYVVYKEWVNDGSNTVQITSGNLTDCFGTGNVDNWRFKDVKLEVWEFKTNQSIVAYNLSTDEIKVNIIDHYAFAELWEADADYPNPVDFTSGLNSSGNTFGIGAGEDGWDWSDGIYGYSGCTFNGAVGGMLEMYADYNDESCAYGIDVNITDEIYSLVQAGGRIAVSFYYEWDGNDDPFESSDQVWIKGRWTSPNSGMHELGYDLDEGHSGSDSMLDIAVADNPDDDFDGLYYQDVTDWVESSGIYYFDFGGKLRNSWTDEWGYFRFDNVSVSVYNYSEPGVNLSFDSVNMSHVKAATLTFETQNINPEKFDCVYVNGNHIGMVDYQEVNGSDDWQEVRFDVPVFYFNNSGDIEIKFSGGNEWGCNRTGMNDDWIAKNVNLSLVYSNETFVYKRFKSMLIMSDGAANTLIGDCQNYGSNNCPTVSGWKTPSEETVEKGCEAHEKYGITIYTVAFGNAGAEAINTLNQTACCDDCSHFYTSNNADELLNIYSQIAQGILNASFEAQRIEIHGEVDVENFLFTDSYIEVNYTSYTVPPQYGEVTITFESPTLFNSSGDELITHNATGTKEGWFYVPLNNTEVLDAKVTSYSSQYWTDRLYVKNATEENWTRVYWLGNYSSNYTKIGDPYTVHIPVELIGPGNNSIRIGTGYAPDNSTGGSPDNKVIYRLKIMNITMEGFSGVFPKAKGSTVTIYYDYDGDNVYDGYSVFSYGTDPYDIFDPYNDSLDDSLLRLLDNLNFVSDINPNSYGNGTAVNPYDGVNQTNPIDLQIISEIEILSSKISGVPSLWGPVGMEMLVWI